jgi:hypothetical protein
LDMPASTRYMNIRQLWCDPVQLAESLLGGLGKLHGSFGRVVRSVRTGLFFKIYFLKNYFLNFFVFVCH